MKIYLSASIVNAPLNEDIAKLFEQAGCEVYLPHRISPQGVPQQVFPRQIREACLREMERSDMGLLVLDSYGRDSAWEVGWYAARKKPIVGWAESSLRFLQDWMVKGDLAAILTRNTTIHSALKDDPIIPPDTVLLIETPEYLAKTLVRLGPNVA